jgi:hypothetical protein
MAGVSRPCIMHQRRKPQFNHTQTNCYNMKTTLFACITTAVLMAISCTGCSDATGENKSSSSATPAGEQAFLSAYRKALENSDTKTLDSFLMTEGTPAEVVEFFKMMNSVPAGATLVDVTLESPTAEETAEFNRVMPMPDGKSYKLPITPTKKLVVTMKVSGENANSTSKATLPVAEKDGKLMIPLPVPAA